jgi:hypothetical protein
MSIEASKVREARAFLRGRVKAGTRDISPRRFAAAAQELSVGYRELLMLIARLQAQGQSAGVFRMELLRKAVGGS